MGGNYRAAAIGEKGWMNCNLRTQFGRLIRRAGLTPWPRLLHNLRASRETELAAEFPLHVVTRWLGNTPRIAMKHYLQVTEDDFARAAGKATASPESAASDAKPAAPTPNPAAADVPARKEPPTPTPPERRGIRATASLPIRAAARAAIRGAIRPATEIVRCSALQNAVQ